MSPRHERELAMDDMADYAQNLPRSQPVNLIDRFDQLPTEELAAEGNALSARMLGSEFSTRDFAVVVALTHRLQRAAVAHARSLNREPLEGMLYLGDIAEERHAAAPALRFEGVDRRHA